MWTVIICCGALYGRKTKNYTARRYSIQQTTQWNTCAYIFTKPTEPPFFSMIWTAVLYLSPVMSYKRKTLPISPFLLLLPIRESFCYSEIVGEFAAVNAHMEKTTLSKIRNGYEGRAYLLPMFKLNAFCYIEIKEYLLCLSW